MAKRSISETFRAIKPRRERGIPEAPPIAVGVSSDSGDLSSSLSQAGQQITQLQAAYQQQAALIAANTQAIQSNTSSKSTPSTVGSAVSGILGGGLGLLSPLISGIAKLFGGGSSAPVQLPVYTPPPAIALSANLSAPVAASTPAVSAAPLASQPAAPLATSGQTAAPSPQITVNVNAMDSQSFMDRSSDIASAVREAMLNMHPINEVISNL